MPVADLDLDLDIFAGPFDLLMAVVLREEVSLLDLQLGEVVVAYIEHLEEEGELELEVATEFLVLIAALLELKSRLMLPGPEDELDDLSPQEAIEELIARMLEYRRYRDASKVIADRFESQRGYLYRSAPLPRELRQVAVDAAVAVYDPEALGAALGDLLTEPADVDLSHIRPTVSLERRMRVLRDVLRGRSELRLRRGVRRRGPADPGGHRLRAAGALPQGRDHLGAVGVLRADHGSPEGLGVNDLSRTVEALLFLSPQPVSVADLAAAIEATEGQVSEAIELLREDLAAGPARGRPARGLRRLRPRQRPGQRGSRPAPALEAADAAADPGPGRDPGDRRLPAAGHPAGGGPDPRRLLRVGGPGPGRARPDRRGRALAVRRGDLQDVGAVRASLWAQWT